MPGIMWSAAWIIRHSSHSCVHHHWVVIRYMGRWNQWHCCHSQLTLIIWVQLAADPPCAHCRAGRIPASPKALLMSLHLESSCSETVHHRTRSRLRAANTASRENIIQHISAFVTEKIPEKPTFCSVPHPKAERSQGSFNMKSMKVGTISIQINTNTEIFWTGNERGSNSDTATWWHLFLT